MEEKGKSAAPSVPEKAPINEGFEKRGGFEPGVLKTPPPPPPDKTTTNPGKK